MGKGREKHWLIAGLAAVALAFSLPVAAGQQSDLSRWVSDVATPEIRELLSQHPRYQGQTLRLESANRNGMTDALVTVLTLNLGNGDGITLHSPVPPLKLAAPGRIDDLSCIGAEAQQLRLLVAVAETGSRQAQVDISLVEPENPAVVAQSWQWRGRFSRAERDTYRKTVASADGSLSAPWTERDVEPAALGLHRQLACALRPQIRTRLGLQWSDLAQLPPLLADTVNRSRHLVGSYAELGITADSPDFRVGTELKPLRDNTWQLWLTAEPLKDGLAPVQAVAYFRSDELQRLREPQQVREPRVPYAPPPRQSGPRPGPALDYLAVEMVDAWLGNARAGKAELQVQLRLENRAAWPIDYSLRVSAGHYQHCIPEPAQYRHDRFGRLAGRLEPGQVLVKPLVVKGAQHRPNPWFGAPSCAGFRSLEGFEEFADKGESVTEYVRWSF